MADVELTERELALLRSLAAGQSRKSIAREAGLAGSTVDGYAVELLSLLGARNDAQAVDIGHRLGLLGEPSRVDIPAPAPPGTPRLIDPPAVIRHRRQVLDDALHGGRGRRSA